MPGKVNPVMAEVINQVAFQVIGNDHTICLASEAGGGKAFMARAGLFDDVDVAFT